VTRRYFNIEVREKLRRKALASIDSALEDPDEATFENANFYSDIESEEEDEDEDAPTKTSRKSTAVKRAINKVHSPGKRELGGGAVSGRRAKKARVFEAPVDDEDED
jgi:hypothetical protein